MTTRINFDKKEETGIIKFSYEKSNQIVKTEDKISELKDCARELEPHQTECLSNIQTVQNLPFG